MRIGYILDSVDHGTIVLPEFQRGYVWTREQVKGLIQSLYRRYPVGGLLIWNTPADTTDLRGAPTGAAGAGALKLLLDGQQRVTSLYGVLRGKPPQFFEDPERAKAFTGLHFHLGSEVFEFYRPSTMSGDPMWISVTKLMQEGPEQVMSGLADLDAPLLFTYVNRLQRLHSIRDVELHDENISGADMTVDVVVDIFNRVNSGGTKLSKGDLALARVCALRPAARDELRTALERWRAAGFDFTFDWFLRCVNVVVTGRARFEVLSAVSGEDFGVGVKRASQAIDFALNLISTRLGLDHDRVLLGRYGIAVMVRAISEQGGSITDTKTQNDLLYWFIQQGMWGRYSTSTESVLESDLEALDSGGIEGLIRQLERWRGTLIVRPDDFDTQTIGSRFYPILYLLTRVNDAQEFCSGLPLSAHLLGQGSRLEVHHLFPKNVLYRGGYERRDVNAVGNYAFLTGDCNRRLSDRSAHLYFPEVEANHPGVLASQWVTDDPVLWQTSRYRDFLEDRRRRLAAATNAFLASLRTGDAASPVIRSSSASVADDDEGLGRLSDWLDGLGLARPQVPAEILDPVSGEALVYADAAWHDGLQVGRTEKVALVLSRDEETEARLGELGYTFFTSELALRHYIEKLLNVDLDGDGIIGEPVDGHPDPSSGRRRFDELLAAASLELWEDNPGLMSTGTLVPTPNVIDEGDLELFFDGVEAGLIRLYRGGRFNTFDRPTAMGRWGLLSRSEEGGWYNAEYLPQIAAYVDAVLRLGYPKERVLFELPAQALQLDLAILDDAGNVVVLGEAKRDVTMLAPLVRGMEERFSSTPPDDDSKKRGDEARQLAWRVWTVAPPWLWLIGPGTRQAFRCATAPLSLDEAESLPPASELGLDHRPPRQLEPPNLA